KLCCATALNVKCGEGVNIYASNYDWNSPGHLTRQAGQLMALYAWRKKLALSHDNDAFVQRCIKKARKFFAFLALRHALKKHALWPKEPATLSRRDQGFWLWFPLNLLELIPAYLLKIYDPVKESNIFCSDGS